MKLRVSTYETQEEDISDHRDYHSICRMNLISEYFSSPPRRRGAEIIPRKKRRNVGRHGPLSHSNHQKKGCLCAKNGAF